MKSIRILFALLACIAIGMSANAQLSFVDNVEARQNSYAEVSVVMSNDEPIRGFQFDLTFPEGLEPTITKVGDTDHTITVSKVENSYRVLGYSMDNAEYPVNFGEVVKIWFHIPVDYPLGEYYIVMSNAYLSNASNDKISLGYLSTILKIMPPIIDVTSIQLNNYELILRVGQSTSVTATVSPSNATYPEITWSSADPAIATVDANGVITAVTLGQTTVTATATNGATASLTVTVEATPTEGISLDKTSIALKVGDTDHLIATVTPADATDKTVIWSSSDSSVATVDSDGNITAVSVGTVTITAACGGNTDICEVTVTLPVVKAVPGDANGDGKVTVTDVVCVVSTIMEEDVDDFQCEAADVNGDGKITVTDIVGIVDIILAKQ